MVPGFAGSVSHEVQVQPGSLPGSFFPPESWFVAHAGFGGVRFSKRSRSRVNLPKTRGPLMWSSGGLDSCERPGCPIEWVAGSHKGVEALSRFTTRDCGGSVYSMFCVALGEQAARGSELSSESDRAVGAVHAGGRFLLFHCHEDLRGYVTSRRTGNRSVAQLRYLFSVKNSLEIL